MPEIQRILCPTDFSETSQQAFEYAERLASDTGAELVLLHVFDLPDFWESGGAAHKVDPELEKQLTAIRPRSERVRIEYLLHAGNAAEVICWLAQERGCDLIVMGTHGRSGLLHALLGSVAEFVVRNARCPVLTVRHRSADEEPFPQPDTHVPMPPLM